MNSIPSLFRLCWFLAAVRLLVRDTSAQAQGLVWERQFQEIIARPGDTNADFAFGFTNTASTKVVVTAVKPSCGCTSTRIPALPWRLEPGGHGVVGATVDLRGKRGLIRKLLTVESSAGTNILTVSIRIPEDRTGNQRVALADRQAVFKGDCASCHVTPAVGRSGAGLYQTACGICHEAAERASMVPDLGQVRLKMPRDRAYWELWVREGKSGTLMPAFAKSHGGPLEEDQIRSLVDYLAALPTAATQANPPAK